MSKQLKAWAVQFKYAPSDPWEWMRDVRGRLAAHMTREAAMHASHREGQFLSPRCTRVVRIVALEAARSIRRVSQ